MNEHELRDEWLRALSADDDARIEADAVRDQQFSHHQLFDALPTDLDSLLRDCFGNRAWRPFDGKPGPLGYLHLIDDRQANDVEHDIVCRKLFAQLKAIGEWCRDRQINLLSLVGAEMEEQKKFYKQRWVTCPSKDPYRNPMRLLDIVKGVIDGNDTEAFQDLLKLGKTVPVNHTMSKLRAGIDSVISSKACSGMRTEGPIPSEPTMPNADAQLVTAQDLASYFKKATGEELSSRRISDVLEKHHLLPVIRGKGKGRGSANKWLYVTIRSVLIATKFKGVKIVWPETFHQ